MGAVGADGELDLKKYLVGDETNQRLASWYSPETNQPRESCCPPTFSGSSRWLRTTSARTDADRYVPCIKGFHRRVKSAALSLVHWRNSAVEVLLGPAP
jgi:hypothetical protein